MEDKEPAAPTTWLAGLTRLQRLSLPWFDFTDDAIGLAPLINLTHLHLHGCKGSALVQLQGMSLLQELTLWGVWPGDKPEYRLQGLSRFISLTSLNVSGSDRVKAADVVGIAILTNMRYLNVAYCEWASDDAAVVSSLSSLVNLQTLLINDMKLGCAGAVLFGSLTQLRELDVSNCGLGDESAARLAGLRELTSLKVDQNMFGPLAAARLAALVNLRELDASDNPLGLAGIEQLASLTKLTRLGIRRNTLPASHGSLHVPLLGMVAQLWQWPLQLLGLRDLQGASSSGDVYMPLTRLTRLRSLSASPVGQDVRAALYAALIMLERKRGVY